ncbi:MAG TPA: hypothetical protein VFU10_08320 [Gaiellaceae bacterium]|nr:hypothetical protein [Gaiellaceae bacterium]
MSSIIEHHGTGADEAPPAEAPSRHVGGRRVGRLVLGSVALVAALALLGSAIAGVFALENNRDSSGYFVTHTHHYRTSAYALTTQSLHVGGATGVLEDALVRLRIAATSDTPAKPLFIGIARTQDVNRYLAVVKHDELRDINFDPFKIDYRRLGAGAPASRPTGQTFWQARASGTGTQTITWPVKRGRWSAVVMNADGSRNVGVDAQLAAQVTGAWWFIAAFIALGALALAGGIALVLSGARKRSTESSSESEQV